MCFENLNDLYKYLSDEYGLIKYKDLTKDDALKMYEDFIQKKYTTAYLVFCVNIWRTLSTYRVLLEGYKSLKSKEFFVGQFERNSPNETIMILLITNIEVYLRMSFINIASVSTRNSVNYGYFSKFKRIFRINNTGKLTDFINSNINLNKLLPPIEQLEFQRSEVCCIAYKLCNIEIPQIDGELWRRLYSGEVDGYIRIRNKLIHGGFQSSIEYEKLLNTEFIEEVIIDIVKLAYKIDSIVVEEYSSDEFPKLYIK